MKKICFGKMHSGMLIILITLSNSLVQGQGFYNTVNWKFSNPKQFGFTIQDVDYFDNNNVIAVGSDGGIARSTDGGSNWTYGPFTFINATALLAKPIFSDVHFVTANTAYAVGSQGAMAKTIDGGINWSLITSPLFANAKTINAVWFLNKDTGYIGGQWNSVDSIPKLYFTKNGGTTWDSLVSPIGGKTRVGYINNPNLPPFIWDVTAKGKEIHRIEFTSPTSGYIVGSGQSHFPAVPAANATTCLPTGANTSTSANNAALVWKFSNGILTDYSLSKEKLGYSGIVVATTTCTSTFNAAQVAPVVQTYKAMNIINDSLIVMMSFNNNTVLRVHTGRNDSTLNLATGVKESGRYEIMNFPFPPTAGPNAGTPIPATQVLLASNPYQLKRAGNGKLCAAANFGYMWTSVDTGRNWKQEFSLPQGKNYSSFATWALDIAPNGKFLSLGQNGVVADSVPGSTWKSNYLTVPVSAGYIKLDFPDCNNGMAAGSSNITVTTDGGATWIDKGRADFAASFYSINGMTYPTPSKAYFAVSNGTIYFSGDQGTTLDPVFADLNMQMNDVTTIGNDTVWALGYSSFSVAAAARTSKVFRSTNAGLTWSTYSGFPVGTLAPNLTDLEFPTKLVGYAAGNRDTIYKTTDAGTTWNKLPLPTPGVTPQITYRDMFCLDANTVFLVGNGFPRKSVIRTTDGGATWTDISGNIGLLGLGNLTGITMHDINNGYIVSPGLMVKTTDGGVTWVIDAPPTNCLFETVAFAPRSVPASIPFANRKIFVTGANISGSPIMEYGNPANIAVNATETVVNATCTNTAGGSITINATGAIAPYTYSINGGAFQTSNIFSGLTQGAKTITIKDSYCGTLTKTVIVGFTDNLTLIKNNDTTVCANAPVQLLATSSAAIFAWSPAAGLSNAAIANPIATVSTTTAYTVTATLNTCVKTATVRINIKPNPVVSAGPDKTIVAGDAVILDGAGSNAVTIAWTPANTLTGANTYTPLAKPAATTTYTMSVTDNNSCTSTDNTIITVIPYCLQVMNAFSPNGDGINDKWLATNGAGCTNQIIVTVYNRYGTKIYGNDNYRNDWDGTYNGKPVPDGTYYYLITYRLINGTSQVLRGDVTILR